MMRKSLYLLPMTLALALSACSDAPEAEGAASGEALENIAAPDGQQWSNMVSKTDAGGIVMGNPDAPIKLVEFMSITCSHCRDFGDQAFDTIRDEYVNSGRVSFEIRNFVRDPVDLSASLLTRCGGESPYFALTKQALGGQNEFLTTAQQLQQSGQLESLMGQPATQRFVSLAESLGMISFFQQRGISEDQARACLSDEAAAEKLIEDTQAAVKDFDVQGTPTFLINGQTVDGFSWPIVETKLKEAGAR